jgi:hypothetical protein
MEYISINETNKLLGLVDLKIGVWSQITPLDEPSDKSRQNYTRYYAPRGARELYVFAEHLAGWIPSGGWKILKIDQSTSLDAVHAAPILRMLFCQEKLSNPEAINQASLIFRFGPDRSRNMATELLISNLIHFLLLFECHAQLTSSGSGRGQFLSIQDGFVYFKVGKDMIHFEASDLLKDFESSPTRSPPWIAEKIKAADQVP